MLLRTSRQGRGYVGLHEPTGKPVEGRLVGVIPTKTSGLGKREASISHEGTVTGNNRAASLIVSTRPRLVFSLFEVSTLGRKIVSM